MHFSRPSCAQLFPLAWFGTQALKPRSGRQEAHFFTKFGWDFWGETHGSISLIERVYFIKFSSISDVYLNNKQTNKPTANLQSPHDASNSCKTKMRFLTAVSFSVWNHDEGNLIFPGKVYYPEVFFIGNWMNSTLFPQAISASFGIFASTKILEWSVAFISWRS